MSVIWIDPGKIRLKISPHADLSGVRDGDWDFARAYPLVCAVKYRAITQRYAEGRRWEDTSLFRDTYARRIASESIRGVASMPDLLAQYYGRVDDMFRDMERNGFRLNGGPLPRLLVGRSGEVFIGNQGNHRLAMAHVLGLDRFAGEVVCRHKAFLIEA